MKKIGLLNFQYSQKNYGAVIQSAALHYIVENLNKNYEVEHINFIPEDESTPPLSFRQRITRLLTIKIHYIVLKKI